MRLDVTNFGRDALSVKPSQGWSNQFNGFDGADGSFCRQFCAVGGSVLNWKCAGGPAMLPVFRDD
jgi:hypothetical protein